MATCPTFYPAYLPSCPASIVIEPENVIADGTYGLRITDKFCSIYWLEITASGGVLTASTSTLPDGLMTPFSGSFKLHLYNSVDGCDTISLTFCNTIYQCIILKIREVQGVVSPTIKCCGDCNDFSEGFSDDFCN